jgi:fructokinase
MTTANTLRPAIGVDLGGTKIEAIVLDPAGASLWRERVPTPAGDYRAILEAVAALVARAEHDVGMPGCSVGVGTPGALTVDGLIKNANSTCLNGEPLQRDLARVLGRPVRVANDANCLALSEATDGAAASAAVSFSVILGTGVGAGIVVGGRLLDGPNRLAGEWGHNPLPWADANERPGPACYCGQHGCIETWLCGPGLVRDHALHASSTPGKTTVDAPLDARQIAAGAAAGDAACAASLRRHESRLARSLAHVINLLDPDVIVLAGGLSALDDLYVNVPRLWDRHVFSGGVADTVRTRLVKSCHGDSSGVRGAAWLWRA